MNLTDFAGIPYSQPCPHCGWKVAISMTLGGGADRDIYRQLLYSLHACGLRKNMNNLLRWLEDHRYHPPEMITAAEIDEIVLAGEGMLGSFLLGKMPARPTRYQNILFALSEKFTKMCGYIEFGGDPAELFRDLDEELWSAFFSALDAWTLRMTPLLDWVEAVWGDYRSGVRSVGPKDVERFLADARIFGAFNLCVNMGKDAIVFALACVEFSQENGREIPPPIDVIQRVQREEAERERDRFSSTLAGMVVNAGFNRPSHLLDLVENPLMCDNPAVVEAVRNAQQETLKISYEENTGIVVFADGSAIAYRHHDWDSRFFVCRSRSEAISSLQ